MKQNTRLRNKDSYKANYNDKLNFHYDFSTGRSLMRNASDFSAGGSVDSRDTETNMNSNNKRYRSFIESQDNALRNKLNRNSKFVQGNVQGRNKSVLMTGVNNRANDLLNSDRGSLSLKTSVILNQMDTLNGFDSANISVSSINKSGVNVNFDELLKSQGDSDDVYSSRRDEVKVENQNMKNENVAKLSYNNTQASTNVNPTKESNTNLNTHHTKSLSSKTQPNNNVSRNNNLSNNQSKILPKSSTSHNVSTSSVNNKSGMPIGENKKELTEKEKFLLAVKNKNKVGNKSTSKNEEDEINLTNVAQSSAMSGIIQRNVGIVSSLKNNLMNKFENKNNVKNENIETNDENNENILENKEANGELEKEKIEADVEVNDEKLNQNNVEEVLSFDEKDIQLLEHKEVGENKDINQESEPEKNKKIVLVKKKIGHSNNLNLENQITGEKEGETYKLKSKNNRTDLNTSDELIEEEEIKDKTEKEEHNIYIETNKEKEYNINKDEDIAEEEIKTQLSMDKNSSSENMNGQNPDTNKHIDNETEIADNIPHEEKSKEVQNILVQNKSNINNQDDHIEHATQIENAKYSRKYDQSDENEEELSEKEGVIKEIEEKSQNTKNNIETESESKRVESLSFKVEYGSLKGEGEKNEENKVVNSKSRGEKIEEDAGNNNNYNYNYKENNEFNQNENLEENINNSIAFIPDEIYKESPSKSLTVEKEEPETLNNLNNKNENKNEKLALNNNNTMEYQQDIYQNKEEEEIKLNEVNKVGNNESNNVLDVKTKIHKIDDNKQEFMNINNPLPPNKDSINSSNQSENISHINNSSLKEDEGTVGYNLEQEEEAHNNSQSKLKNNKIQQKVPIETNSKSNLDTPSLTQIKNTHKSKKNRLSQQRYNYLDEHIEEEDIEDEGETESVEVVFQNKNQILGKNNKGSPNIGDLNKVSSPLSSPEKYIATTKRSFDENMSNNSILHLKSELSRIDEEISRENSIRTYKDFSHIFTINKFNLSLPSNKNTEELNLNTITTENNIKILSLNKATQLKDKLNITNFNLEINSIYPNKKENISKMKIQNEKKFLIEGISNKVLKSNPVTMRDPDKFLIQCQTMSFNINSAEVPKASPESKGNRKMYISSPISKSRPQNIDKINDSGNLLKENLEKENDNDNVNYAVLSDVNNEEMEINAVKKMKENLSHPNIVSTNYNKFREKVASVQNKILRDQDNSNPLFEENVRPVNIPKSQRVEINKSLNSIVIPEKIKENPVQKSNIYSNLKINSTPNLNFSQDEIEINDEILYEFKEKYFGKLEFIDREMLIQFYKKYMKKEFNPETDELFGSRSRRNHDMINTNHHHMTQKELLEYLKKNNMAVMQQEQIENKLSLNKLKKMLDINDKKKDKRGYSNGNMNGINFQTNNVNVLSPNSRKSKKFIPERSDNRFGIMPTNQIDPNASRKFLPISLIDNYDN